MAASALSAGFAWLFFRQVWGMFLTWPAGVCFYKTRLAAARTGDREERLREFKDALVSAENLLRAGYALENALQKAAGELERMRGDRSRLMPVWRTMCHRISLGMPVGEAFASMAAESGLQEAAELAGLLSDMKRSGGSIAELLRVYTERISEKLSLMGEIRSDMASKRTENNIMLMLVPGMLLYLSVTSYSWIAVLYETAQGRLFMAGGLAVYTAAGVLADRILKVEV